MSRTRLFKAAMMGGVGVLVLTLSPSSEGQTPAFPCDVTCVELDPPCVNNTVYHCYSCQLIMHTYPTRVENAWEGTKVSYTCNNDGTRTESWSPSPCGQCQG